MPVAQRAVLVSRLSRWIGVTLPPAEPDEPTIRHRLRSGKAGRVFRVALVIELVAFRFHLTNAAARQAERTGDRFVAVLRGLRQNRRKQIRRLDRLRMDEISATRIGI